jgi:hypothetical protein
MHTDLTGLFGITLGVVALLFRLPQLKTLPLTGKAGVLGAAIIVLSIPFGGLSLAGVVRGIAGDLSMTTLVFLALALVRSFSGYSFFEESNRQAALRAILIAAMLFYPLALGLSMFDPYRMGFGNVWFLLALLGLAVWASLRYSTLLALCVALGVAAWSLGWYESTNLWDYLQDPWLAVYAFAAEVKYLLARWKGKAHA